MAESIRFAYRSSKIKTKIVLRRVALPFCPKRFCRADLIDDLADLLHTQFERRGTLADLEEAIVLERKALELRPPGHPDRDVSLRSLAFFLHSRFKKLGTLSDLDKAIALQYNVLELCPQGHPDCERSLTWLASYLHARFIQLGTLSDLDEAVAIQHEILELLPQGHPRRATLLGNLAMCLRARYQQLGALSDVEAALALQRDVVKLCPWGHRDSLSWLARDLYTLFQQFGSLSDLDEAISLQHNVTALYPPEHPDRARSLTLLASYFFTRSEQCCTLFDLDEAIYYQHEALELHPQGHPRHDVSPGKPTDSLHSRFFKQLARLSDRKAVLGLKRNALQVHQGQPDRAISMHELAIFLFVRFWRLGTLTDLEEAIFLQHYVLELRPHGHPERAVSLTNLAFYLHARFRHLGTFFDLNAAIALEHWALELRPQGHLDRVLSLDSLAIALHTRFQHLGTLSDLDEALAFQRQVTTLRPQAHPDQAISLGKLASILHSRFWRLRTVPDLEEAIALERTVLEFYSQSHPDRAIFLYDLAFYLHARFQLLGTICDLNEAVAVQRSVTELCPQGHPDRARSLGWLAFYLYARYEQLEDLSNIDEALAAEHTVLGLLPPGHPRRVISLGNLAFSHYRRFRALGVLSDLEEAYAFERCVFELYPQENLDRAISMSNLATCLYHRFKQLGTSSDLERAITLENDALEYFPHEHPERAGMLDNIALYLHARFKKLETLPDLEEALSAGRAALDLLPKGHPDRPLSLVDIASCLWSRFKHSATHDIHDVHEIYSELSAVSQSVSFTVLEHVKPLIQESGQHPATVLAYQMFLHLIVQHLATAPYPLPRISVLKQLTTSAAVDGFSACVRCDNPIRAVELVEQGRGVFWSQLVPLRSSLDEVMASGDAGKKLADKLMQITCLLRIALSPPNFRSRHDAGYHLNIQFQDVVTNIRNLPGLSRFLQPPLFSDLRIAAACGPVVIVNASQHRCEALIILLDQDPVPVVLPITKSYISELSLKLTALTGRARLSDVTEELMMYLRELWDVIVFPIVQTLERFCPRGSRIWWCPTAEFTSLPLHATGSYRDGESMLSDLYISSYTPTLAALIRARQKRPSHASIEPHRLLVVGEAEAPGRIGRVTTVTCIQGQDVIIANVTEGLTKNEFVHFSCHGVPDQMRAFESGFALGDGLLTMDDIMRCDLQNSQFAYLSACHAVVGDEDGQNEVIHIATAMHFAGFPSVVGTTGAVDDAHTVEIASRFYDNMLDESGRLDHTHAALALHKTMNNLRSSDIPLDQRILYIHVGV